MFIPSKQAIKGIAKMSNVKKTLLFTFYYANNKITCIRCNITGKFVSIKKYLATQKANAIVVNAQAKKPIIS